MNVIQQLLILTGKITVDKVEAKAEGLAINLGSPASARALAALTFLSCPPTGLLSASFVGN